MIEIENELRQINDMRIKTLETIIQEKVKTIKVQEQELNK